MKAISFRGLDLQSDPYRVVDTGELFNSPVREIIAKDLARSDNSVAVFRKYKGGRTFTLSGTIRDVDSDALERAIDALKLYIMDQIGDVAVGWAGSTRYYNAEGVNVNIARRATDINRCAWSAQFYMAKPFSVDIATKDLITPVTAQTLGSKQFAVNNTGTYLALPLITLTLTDMNPNVSDVSIVIGNPASAEYLTITDTFADGDIITIDSVNEQVFLNGNLINPSGEFPAWSPGSGLMDYSDSGSSRSINVTATYNQRDL